MKKLLIRPAPFIKSLANISFRTLSIAILSTSAIAGASALAYSQLKTQPPQEPRGNQFINYGAIPTQAPTAAVETQPVTAPSTPTAPTPVTYTPPKSPDNTARCNSILAAGEADLLSLNTQINQQLAIMKQVMGNEGSGLGAQIDGGGVSGMIGQSEQSESFNQANDEATTLSNQIDPDRQNYISQLEGLQCWSQAGTMLDYNAQQ